MKKIIFIIMISLSGSCINFAQTLDPGYTKTFGTGVIIASINGYPGLAKYDPAQFIFKDGVFFVKGDEESTLDLRLLLPKGMTEGKLLDKLKKEKPQNLKHRKDDFSVWQIWSSHTTDARENFNSRTPWPQKLSDVPLWGAPICEHFYSAGKESKDWNSSGWSWKDDLQTSVGNWLKYSKPGQKLYAVYRLCYEYSVPGGQMENKWDAVLQRWIPTKSVGGIGYVMSDPIAACTIEIFGDEISADRFKDNGNGTVTDSKTGLIWEKKPTDKRMLWPEASEFAKAYRLGDFSDWRLPTVKELEVMMKISKAKDKQYKCDWLNKNGFSNIFEWGYWTSDAYFNDGVETEDKMAIDMRYKIIGKDYANSTANYVWMVRSGK